MNTIPLTPEERAKYWGTIAKWATFIVVGFLFAPYAVVAITGMLGLIVGCGIAAGTWLMLPVVEAKAMNLRLKMIKAEAAKNPIETLESEYLRRQLLLDQRKTAIETFDAKTRTFGDKLDGFKRDYPDEAQKFQSTYDQMALLLKRQKDQWREASRGLALFDGEIKKAKAMWDMAQAANAARAGSGLDEESFNAKLKTETALDSIQDGMNRAFSQLDTLILESDNADPQIETKPAALPAAGSTLDGETPATHRTKTAR